MSHQDWVAFAKAIVCTGALGLAIGLKQSSERNPVFANFLEERL
jgi:hypothetical protein